MPSLYIITGSNGAGKSSFGHNFLPKAIQDGYIPFDGDKLGLEKRVELFRTIKSSKEVRKLADEWVNTLFLEKANYALDTNDHFVYEGHFREEWSWRIPRRFRRKGYTLVLIFMGLSDPLQSQLRVLERANNGGHNVPEYEIVSNFYGNLQMINKYHKLFDESIYVDTSQSAPKILLHLKGPKVFEFLPTKEMPFWFSNFLPKAYKILVRNEKALG